MARRIRHRNVIYIPDANPLPLFAFVVLLAAALATVGLLLALWLYFDNERDQTSAGENVLATSSPAMPAPSTTRHRSPAGPFTSEGFTRQLESANSIDPDKIATVLSVTDGDTFRAEFRGRNEPVRLIGIDAPETRHPDISKQCFGEKASARLASMLTGERVFLVRDGYQENRDPFGRLLRFVFLEDRSNVNEALVRGGFATYEEQYPVAEPFRTELDEAERAAVDSRAGLWRTCR